MVLEKLVKHVVIGAGAVWITDKSLSSYLSKKAGMSEEEKNKYKTIAKGTVLGGVTGDYIGEEINNGSKYNLHERIQNIALGALAGAVGTYLLINGRHRIKNKQQAASTESSSQGSGYDAADSGSNYDFQDSENNSSQGEEFETC